MANIGRAGGSASRIIGDQGLTDPGGGVGRRPPSWQLPVGHGRDINGPQTPSVFRLWEASPRRIVDAMIERVWTTLKGCWEVGTDWCRSIQSRWMKAHGRWFPRVSKLEGMGGGCGRPEGMGHVMKNEPMAVAWRTDTRPLSLEAE